MSAERAETPVQPPLGQLERALIDQFVRERGHDPARLSEMSEPEREKLLRQASLYASAKLSEVESRSHFLDEMHDGAAGTTKTGLD